MSHDVYSDYVSRIDEAMSDVARGELLVKASRDSQLTLEEFVRLDNLAKKMMKEKKGLK